MNNMSNTGNTVQKPQKPVQLIIEELMSKVCNDINESNLPMFLVEYVFKDILNDLHSASIQQMQYEKQRYQKEVADMQKASESTESK